MKHWLLPFVLVLTACDDHRTVTLLLGPDDNTLTAGFQCKDASGNRLMDRSRSNGNYVFQLVFETVDLGNTLPGCRGEELQALCSKQPCKRISRHCATVHVPAGSSAAEILTSLHDQLSPLTLIDDAPSDPVVVRAVATLQSCDELMPADDSFPMLDADLAIGCAYSCPVVLGELQGSLGMALDTLDEQCGPEVRACAKLAGG